VKTLAGLSVKEALDATHRARTSDVRSRVRKLFEQKKPLESEKAKLEALLGATARLSEERNKILHSAWSETEAGVTVRKRESDHEWERAPSKEQVDTITNQIMELARKINDARFEGGFIYEVVERKRRGKK